MTDFLIGLAIGFGVWAGALVWFVATHLQDDDTEME